VAARESQALAATRFAFRLITRIALVAPLLLTMAWCFLMQPTPAALAAPALGPWAGRPLGHEECTMAHQMPVISIAVLIAGLVVGISRLIVTNAVARGVLSVLLVLCVLSWCLLALLSVVNTTI
jgi:hypothetical protein